MNLRCLVNFFERENRKRERDKSNVLRGSINREFFLFG